MHASGCTYIAKYMCVATGVTMATTNLSAGKKEFTFPSMIEFLAWKEKEEEISNTSYVKTQQTYHPKLCCLYRIQ